MRRVLEFSIFLSVAAGLHLAALAMTPEEDGMTAEGEGGEAIMSLSASSESVAEMVEEWDRPPETVAALDPPAPPPPPPTLAPRLEPPRAMPAPATTSRPQTPGLAVPRMESLSEMDTAAPPPPPPPPPPPEPEPQPESEQEPEAIPATESAAAVSSSLRPTSRPLRPEPVEREEAARQRQRETQASPAQRAAGEGQGAAAGTTRRAETSTLSQSQRQSLTARWGGQVRAAIERRKRYPTDARGISGTAVVRITVGRDGSLRGLALALSSGSAALDQAALRAVQAARSFPPAPAGLTDPTYTFTLPMTFSS